MADSVKKKIQHVQFVDETGTKLQFMAKSFDKRWRDVLAYHHGYTEVEEKGKKILQVKINPEYPLGGSELKPGPKSPLCAQCGLNKACVKNPYIEARGSANPKITIILDSVGKSEDTAGMIAAGGANSIIHEIISVMAPKTGIDPDKDVRWLTMTRCKAEAGVNLKTKGAWCRMHVVQDLMLHPPKLIMPVGTNALGLLCHKSNAGDWQGKLLTYRGWPDDWITDPKFMLPRINPATGEQDFAGHPLFGKYKNDVRIPMWPIQKPYLVYATQNESEKQTWKKAIVSGVELAAQDIQPRTYDRDWYKLSEDPDEVASVLMELIENPGTVVCYDTETTGLKMFSGKEKIVFHMLRWQDKDGNARSIGFPWDYEGSALKEYIPKLLPYVWSALTSSKLIGHNLTFDFLFACATLGEQTSEQVIKRANELAPSCLWDTWHMAFVMRQARGTLGLDMIASKYVPDLGGYEEDLSLLIKLHSEKMDPAAGKGGHYANCPKELWDSAFKPYVMGDVEVCYQAKNVIEKRLATQKRYEIPVASLTERGRFRKFSPQGRDFVYQNIVSPAAQMLGKMMSRGMYIDQEKVDFFEHHYPALINESRNKIAKEFPLVGDWIKMKTEMPREKGDDKVWEFDLESKDVLKEMIFKVLGHKIVRLTKQGKAKYGDKPEDYARISQAELYEYAAVDKFTLNKLIADHPYMKGLLDYRKHYKMYTTYVKSLRNCFSELVDKKRRTDEQHLGFDSCIHSSFLITGTRGGRLASRSPNLQNLPSKSATEKGETEIKEMFTSRFGERGCIYGADLSQIELRLLAAACGDASMVKAYIDEVDLHTLTTSKIFKLPYETFTKENFDALKKSGREAEAKDLELKRRIGKCVDPSTLVSVNGKIMRIGDIHPGREDDKFYDVKDMFIQTPGHNKQPIKQFYCNGVQKRLMVVASQGILVCSETHKFRLPDGSLVMAKDLTTGTILPDAEPLDGEFVDTERFDKLKDQLKDWCKQPPLTGIKGQHHPQYNRNWNYPSSQPTWPRSKNHYTSRLKDGDPRTILIKDSIYAPNWKWAQDVMVLLNKESYGNFELRPYGKSFAIINVYNKGLNEVHAVTPIKDDMLVEISIADPHIHVPNGLACRQTVNFLTGYGGGAFGLQTTLANAQVYLSIEECEHILNEFFNAYPALKRYLGLYKNFIQTNGVAVSLLGRVRIFDEVFSDDKEAAAKALRAGCNHLIQATASDMMLMCLTTIEDLMRAEGLESVLVSTVHDSLVIDAVRSELPKIHEIVFSVLNNIPDVLQCRFGSDVDLSWLSIVPFAGDCSVGPDYQHQNDIPKRATDIDWELVFNPPKSKE